MIHAACGPAVVCGGRGLRVRRTSRFSISRCPTCASCARTILSRRRSWSSARARREPKAASCGTRISRCRTAAFRRISSARCSWPRTPDSGATKGSTSRRSRKSLETDWERGTSMRGASTITQQLAKNLYLSPTRNPVRKLSELFITRRLEHELSKTRIFELYLNNIEWGDGIWGAEAAARTVLRHPGVCGRARPGRADGRRHHQSARAEHRQAQRASSGATADHPRAHGIHHASAGGCGAAACRQRPHPTPLRRRAPEYGAERTESTSRQRSRRRNRDPIRRTRPRTRASRNPEPRTRNRNPELEPGTRNP